MCLQAVQQTKSWYQNYSQQIQHLASFSPSSLLNICYGNPFNVFSSQPRFTLPILCSSSSISQQSIVQECMSCQESQKSSYPQPRWSYSQHRSSQFLSLMSSYDCSRCATSLINEFFRFYREESCIYCLFMPQFKEMISFFIVLEILSCFIFSSEYCLLKALQMEESVIASKLSISHSVFCLALVLLFTNLGTLGSFLTVLVVGIFIALCLFLLTLLLFSSIKLHGVCIVLCRQLSSKISQILALHLLLTN